MRQKFSGKARLVAVLLSGFMAFPAQAETLTDALVSAYNNSDLLDQARALLRAADEDVASAVAVLRPTLDYSIQRDWTFLNDNAIPGADRDGVETTLGLTSELVIYEGGRNKLAIEAAKEAVLAAREALLVQEQAVLFDAVEAYLEVIRAAETVDLRRNNVRVLQEEVRAARDRFEVGEVTRTDVAQAQSRLAQSEADLVSAEGDLQTAREDYNLQVGRYPGQLAPPPALPSTASSIDAAREIALRAHPAILRAQRLVTVAEINAVRAEAAVLPSISANASVGYSDFSRVYPDNGLEPSASIGLSLRGPIYRGGAINSAFRRAQADRDNQRSTLLRTTAEIDEQVGRAWAVRDVARARLVATDRQIEAAQIAFDGTREEATLGARTTLDVLDAEQELLDARGAKIDANALEQLAVYGLLASMGRLTVDGLGLPVTAYDPSIYYNAVRNAPAVGSAQGIQLERVLKSIGKY
ncbi:TolC family outer membrane protein [Fluviibacterium sp. DFM31]|uniref:TolC family outer membrane protein n=1 Tax=Meridianimarinicoccus marinus TaxID=3231483 RepID=A0ABV3L6A7_9RHOB